MITPPAVTMLSVDLYLAKKLSLVPSPASIMILFDLFASPLNVTGIPPSKISTPTLVASLYLLMTIRLFSSIVIKQMQMPKKIVKAHKYFSFSPREIAEFVKPTPNQEHEIDPLLAQQVWERAKPIFEMRMEFAERFAKIAAENQDWYQPSERTARQIERLAKWHFERHGLHLFDRYEPERLLYNPVPFKGANSSWRLKANPIVKKKPSNNELVHLVATRGKYWTRYEADWFCPCCFRDKYDCVRPSKKNSWIFEVKTASLFSTKDMNFDSNPAPMCVDCVDMALNFGREVLELSGKRSMIHFPSSVLTISELREIVIARPHSQHKFKNEVIDRIIPEIVQRVIKFCDEVVDQSND